MDGPEKKNCVEVDVFQVLGVRSYLHEVALEIRALNKNTNINSKPKKQNVYLPILQQLD